MVTLHHGDCLDVLKTLPNNSVDSIVTDPPYGLAFMGKRWDYDIPSVEIWEQCLRVLKPGGHLLAFAGTRTQHRMAVRIEDAGFEIRDCIMWLFGSGFPKSHDVSKAIDKGYGESRERQLQFTAWMRSTGITAEEINEATSSCMASHYLTDKSQPAIATADMFDKLRSYLPEVPEYIERLVCERTGLEWAAYKQREVVGQKTVNGEEGTAGGYQNGIASVRGSDISIQRQINITAPATEAAKQWEGWGTALKPAYEPCILARKPLEGTVAANVQKWGVGGINVDGCRVGTNGEAWSRENNVESRIANGISATKSALNNGVGAFVNSNPLGRFPANIIHDGSPEVLELFPQTWRSSDRPRHNKASKSVVKGKDLPHTTYGHADNGGSAARFFYCAKASKRDRDEGLEGFELKDASNDDNAFHAKPGRARTPPAAIGGARDRVERGLPPVAPRCNNHPTVKPTDLMRYLCRLITPPNGAVLDPFMGSGSTGKAAVLEGFRFIGIEREAEYVEVAQARIERAHNQHIAKRPSLSGISDLGCRDDVYKTSPTINVL